MLYSNDYALFFLDITPSHSLLIYDLFIATFLVQVNYAQYFCLKSTFI